VDGAGGSFLVIRMELMDKVGIHDGVQECGFDLKDMVGLFIAWLGLGVLGDSHLG